MVFRNSKKPVPGVEKGMPSRGEMNGRLRSFLSGYYPSTCGDIPPNDCNPCVPVELGRVRSAGFIAKDYLFANNDPTDPANWAPGIASGKIYVVPETHGEIADPSPKTGPGFGQTIETLLAYEYSGTYYDPNYQVNWAFYNALKNNRNFLFFYATETQIHITDVPVIITPGAPVPDDLTGMVTWKVGVKWQTKNLTQPQNIPAGLFDECYSGN